jgi:cytochrome c-type biogenesis protein CcmH/NrfG
MRLPADSYLTPDEITRRRRERQVHRADRRMGLKILGTLVVALVAIAVLVIVAWALSGQTPVFLVR